MIRMATEKDIPALLEIYAPYVENTTYSFEYTPPTPEQFTARFRKYTAQCPWLVWEEDERMAYSWCAEVSIYLAPEAQRRGIGRQLYRAVEEILWRQGYRIIYALITSENTASLAFHERVGYARCADFPGCGIKFGRSLGVIWMEKRSNSVELPTTPPIPWHFIVENDRKLANILASFTLP